MNEQEKVEANGSEVEVSSVSDAIQNNSGESNTSWSFVSEEEVLASQSNEAVVNEQPAVTTEEPVVEQSTPVEEVATQDNNDDNTFTVSTDDALGVEDNDYGDLDSQIFSYLSERLGREVSGLEDLSYNEQPASDIPEALAPVLEFMNETGRSVEDWVTYQRLNPSEMDDKTAIQVQLSLDYPTLTASEIETLFNQKYVVDEEISSEQAINAAKLQIKIDADKARKGVDEYRTKYKAPEEVSQPQESLFDEQWVNTMNQELDAMDAIEFDLTNGKKFSLGLGEKYKAQLADKNSRMEEYFDPYVGKDGSWDYDKLNMHRAVVDNIETIVREVYKQGLGDGQRNIVDTAANVSSDSPNHMKAQNNGSSSLADQLKIALGGGSDFTFNV